jgi:hypothetical protein
MTNLKTKENKLYFQKNTTLEMMSDKSYKGCLWCSYFFIFKREICVYHRQVHVSSHTDEFSGAVSLNLRKQSLQNGGKQLSKTVADCNHLLSLSSVSAESALPTS